MLTKGSRYETVGPFQAAERGGNPFSGTRPRPIPPAEGVLEHTVTPGDRLDRLAEHYYNNPKKWWLILDANPDLLTDRARLSLDALRGQIILIPSDTRPGGVK